MEGDVVEEKSEWREEQLYKFLPGIEGPYTVRRSNASVLVSLVVAPRCNWCFFGVGKIAAVCMTIA